jgi:hypothetical protein
MNRLACLLLLVLTPYTFALEIFESQPNRLYLYSEGGIWRVDSLGVNADQWPEIIDSKNFSSEAAAREFVEQSGAAPSQPRISDAGRELVNRSGVTLWTVTNQWDWNWEIKFGEWVKKELHVGWWKQYGIATDCADVVYTSRWIFARINGLPMANTMITGQIVSHRTVKKEWETLPTAHEWFNDQRFMAGLAYVLATTYTHGLWNDSYPIAITPAALIPGTYHLHLAGDSGHTLLVHGVGTKPDEIPVTVLFSNVPSEVREVWSALFLDETADANGAGFVHMRWPRWTNDVAGFVPASQMPHYSTEEFDSSFIRPPRYSFWREVYFRLNPGADFDKIAYRTLEQLLDGFRSRVQVVEKGYAVCSVKRCEEDSAEWSLWSTPSRDGRLAGAVSVFDELTMQVSDWSVFQNLFNSPVVTIEGQSMDLSEAMGVWRSDMYSSDPNDLPRARWGL